MWTYLETFVLVFVLHFLFHHGNSAIPQFARSTICFCCLTLPAKALRFSWCFPLRCAVMRKMGLMMHRAALPTSVHSHGNPSKPFKRLTEQAWIDTLTFCGCKLQDIISHRWTERWNMTSPIDECDLFCWIEEITKLLLKQ